MYRKILLHITLFFLMLLPASQIQSQEINFGGYYNQYSVSTMNLFGDPLNFGEVVAGENVAIPITSAVILEIEGIKYLDVHVSVQATNLVYSGGGICVTTCEIPFDVQAAYINRGANQYLNTNQAVLFTGSPNNLSTRFPIKGRGNAPPGPPPTPLYEGFTPNTDKAYVYLYGSLQVGGARSGSYSSQIIVTIDYE